MTLNQFSAEISVVIKNLGTINPLESVQSWSCAKPFGHDTGLNSKFLHWLDFSEKSDVVFEEFGTTDSQR